VNYSIVTTARNEEKYISRTIESVLKQSKLPAEWVIVNDGSSDKTRELIESYALKYQWITLVDLFNFKPELKSTGGRISHIMNIAARNLKLDYDIIVKLDADTEFESEFFSSLLTEFNKNEKLGIASGHLVFQGKKEKLENYSNFVRGAVMIIRKKVFDEVGGFFESKGRGEDTLFGVAANYYGWESRTFPIFFNHLRSEANRHSSFHESFNTGFYKGSIPYRFDFFMLTQLKHAFKKPIIIGSILQILGYIDSRLIQKYRPFPHYVKIQLHKEQLENMKLRVTGGLFK
jgi:poly-beta-1,6-N-acetyl-D-glucosamine synthase